MRYEIRNSLFFSAKLVTVLQLQPFCNANRSGVISSSTCSQLPNLNACWGLSRLSLLCLVERVLASSACVTAADVSAA